MFEQQQLNEGVPYSRKNQKKNSDAVLIAFADMVLTLRERES